jgi:abequosyltransferase
MGETMAQVRLSICIATLNRCEYLAETITQFTQQMVQGVELVVVDGGSTDGTQLMMQKTQALYPWISYHRLATNGGLDADYDTSVQLAQGQYCWMFSDDDWPLPGALQTIYQACGQGHDFIFADAQVRDVKMQDIFLERRAKLTQDQVLQSGDMDTLFKLTGSALSFIGSCILRRDIWVARDCKSYYGFYFPHIAIIFQQPLAATSLLLYAPLIAIRYGNATWTGSAFKIWMLLWPSLIWKMPSLSDAAKASVTAEQPWRNIRMLMWQRAKGTYTPKQYRDFLAPLPMGSITRLKSRLISIMPGQLAAVIALVSIRFSQRPRKYLTEELKLSPYCQHGLAKWLAHH